MAYNHRVEVLKCANCGKAGVAELSEGDAPFEDHADLIPVGFKAVPTQNGALSFFCTDCNIRVN
jgi:hypothetical protein